jgi:predicted DNA-binding transcriptional regulator AlpA
MMESETQKIDKATFLEGAPLKEAYYTFGDDKLLEDLQKEGRKVNKGREEAFKNMKDDASNSWKNIGESLQSFVSYSQNREKITKMLQNSLCCRIEQGELLAFGFSQPRNINDHPIQIPADLFTTGKIDWNNSTLLSQGLEFAGIKIIFPNHTKTKSTPKTTPEQRAPEHLAGLTPDQYIDEKIAAGFIGISPRTLQGYRSKGGGPEYRKLGNGIVRYKVIHLIEWIESKKKLNTSG